MQYKTFMETLKGKQHKLDKNKNGKLDAHDFKLLRKEESEELEEAEDRMARSDYSASPSGRKSHKYIVFSKLTNKDVADYKKMKEETDKYGFFGSKNPKIGDRVTHKPTGATGTIKSMSTQGNETHINFKSDNDASHIKKGEMVSTHMGSHVKVHKEEVELDERNKENAMMRKTMDASRGARFKAKGNYTPDPEPEHKTAQAHNKAIGRAIRKMSNEEVDLEESHFKLGDTVKCKESGATGKVVKLDKDHGEETDKYYTVKKEDGKTMKFAPNELSLVKEAKDLPFTPDLVKKPVKNSDGTIQSPMSRARELAQQGMKKVMKQKMKEEFGIDMSDEQVDYIIECMNEEVEIDEQAPVAPVPDKKYIKGTPEHKAHMETKKTRVGHPTNVKEDLLSYKEFMMMLEYEGKGGVYRHSGTYGSEYAKKEREKDEKGFDSDDKQSAEKRGRGRPAGAKSGARKITGTSKLYK